MRKMWIVAIREYVAAVRTKTFVIGLLAMPIMMGGGIFMQWLLRDMVDTREKRFALVDRSPGQAYRKIVQEAVNTYNNDLNNSETGQQVKPRFDLKVSDPGPEVAAQRFELSEQVRKGQLRGFLEISGSDVFHLLLGGGSKAGKAPGGPAPPVVLRYQTNRPADEDFARFVKDKTEKAIQDQVSEVEELPPVVLDILVRPVSFESKGLTTKNPDGTFREASEQSRIASLLIPAGLMILMFLVVLMSATPLMQSVVEEKMQRIAEVLLGSVRPFDLMMGKLLGMVGVSLTLSTVYLGGAYWAAHRFGFDEFLSADLLASFVLFQCLAALMYGSLFIAIGAACTDMKETQNLLWPVMLLAMLPVFVLGNVLREPNSPVATGLSFFPFATPMLMITRQAVPPGLPWWQPALGVVLVLATTLLCVYVAGRIFRVGMLLQGKGARLGEIARWVFRG